jgi:shikimate kinase
MAWTTVGNALYSSNDIVRRLTDDREKNIQDIQTQRKEIYEEIHKIRKSLNDHLDQLQETLINIIVLRLNLSSLLNFSTLFSSSFALETK